MQILVETTFDRVRPLLDKELVVCTLHFKSIAQAY